MRAFLAIDLSDEVRRSLAQAGRRLAEAGAAVRWVPEQNLHLTLKFLGEVEQEDVSAIIDVTRRAAAALGPFEMLVRGLGVLPGPSRPRVVHAKVEAPPSLAALATALDPAFESIGVEADHRSFRPHVTIGRVRTPRRGAHPKDRKAAGARLLDALEEFAETTFGLVAVREVIFYESVLGSSGPTYEARALAPLGGGSPPRT